MVKHIQIKIRLRKGKRINMLDLTELISKTIEYVTSFCETSLNKKHFLFRKERFIDKDYLVVSLVNNVDENCKIKKYETLKTTALNSDLLKDIDYNVNYSLKELIKLGLYKEKWCCNK